MDCDYTGWAESRYTVINCILYTYFWPSLYQRSPLARRYFVSGDKAKSLATAELKLVASKKYL